MNRRKLFAVFSSSICISLINSLVALADTNQTVHVPEPMLFDLVRPLGAVQGELEVNTLASFPMRRKNRVKNVSRETDPFGTAPSSKDRKGIEWAPEIEYAIIDDFAIEFEFPFENSTLEVYKLGLQWTIGDAFDSRYIHGVQMLVEPNTDWDIWNSTLLYIGGTRWADTWSALFMIGGRMNLEGQERSESFERLLNISIFNDVLEGVSIGLETNFVLANNKDSNKPSVRHFNR